jgi:hypothetical protein
LVASENLELDQTLISHTQGKGHHVLIPSVNIGAGGQQVFRMERLDRSEFGNKLIEAGLSEQDGHALAMQSGGSFTVFKRLFASSPEIKLPKWGDPAAAAELAPLLLVGAWIDGSKADQEAVSKIAQKPYGDCTRLLNQWRKGSDSPIRLTAGIWEFVSPLDAWSFLHHALGADSLDLFEALAEEVLGADHPAYDLPKEERWQAAVKGKISKFSSEIRHGLAQSVAVLATQPTPDGLANSVPLPVRAHRTVAKLLGNGIGWQRWASLGSVLPLLAEAAPDAFMQAVDADLASGSPQIPLLFDQEVAGITGRAEHTGMLWALERLAWSDMYVAKASDLLARLSQLDPGGNWTNRPEASLRDVFFSWMPYTTAPLEQRLHLIAGITARYPEVGWKLLMDLLPTASDSIGRNSPPEWNFWAEGWSAGVSDLDYYKTISDVVKLAIGMLKQRPEKWVGMLGRFDFLPSGDKESLLGEIEALEPGALSESERQPLWKALRDRIQRYIFYPEARWAPSMEMLSRLQRVRDKFEPTDLIELIAPIFETGFGIFGSRDLPWEEQEKLRQQNRADGVKQILESGGLNRALKLADKVSDSWGVGITLAEVAGDKFLPQIVPAGLIDLNEKRKQFASGYLAWLINANGREWAESKVSSDWTPDETAAFADCMPFKPDTWTFIKALGTKQNAAYWRRVRPHAIRQPPIEVEQAARLLIEAQRGPSAISLLASSTYSKNVPEVHALFDLFELALNTPIDKDERVKDPHEFHAILEVIYAAKDIDDTRLAKIEWNLLPILDRNTLLPHGLHRLLAREPKFFVELMILLFRDENTPEGNEENEPELSQEETHRRRNAWHLRRDFGTIPGGDADGKVDLGKLREWVTTARELAQAAGRLRVCDSTIGQVLAHSGNAEDGSWPILPVREIFEEIASDEINGGFVIGILNRRGVTWRSVTAGGTGTRALAQQWENHAEQCKVKWPRTASALLAVANNYNDQAKREDEDAERRR